MIRSLLPISNVAGYINYFRELAVSHASLQHDPASETGNGPSGSMHFTKISAEQVLSALNTAIGFPCLTIELYELDTESEIPQYVKLHPKGAFMVIDTPADGSFQAEQYCYENTEKIILDILKQIWQDHFAPGVDECQAPFKDFDFGKISITPVGPIFTNQFGYRVVFDFELQNTIDLTAPPEAGTFL